MAVRTHLPWPWRVARRRGAARDRRRHVVVGLRLRADLRRLQPQGDRGDGWRRSKPTTPSCAPRRPTLRARNSQLESELAMTARRAGRRCRSRRIELMRENSQMKEELAFLQKLVSDSSKQAGLSISAADRRTRARRHVALQPAGGARRQTRATSSRARSRCRRRSSRRPGAGAAARPVIVTLPDDQPESAAALRLKFKYYQRLEGTISRAAGRPACAR